MMCATPCTAARSAPTPRAWRCSPPPTRPSNYGLHLDEIARIWKAGCIIRAIFLDEIKKAFKEEPGTANLLMAGRFREAISARQEAWRRVLSVAIHNGIATPAFSASLAYYDSYRRERLPANLIQAQRDFFGAHTYERIDKPGSFTPNGRNKRQPPRARKHMNTTKRKSPSKD